MYELYRKVLSRSSGGYEFAPTDRSHRSKWALCVGGVLPPRVLSIRLWQRGHGQTPGCEGSIDLMTSSNQCLSVPSEEGGDKRVSRKERECILIFKMPMCVCLIKLYWKAVNLIHRNKDNIRLLTHRERPCPMFLIFLHHIAFVCWSTGLISAHFGRICLRFH